MKDAKRFALAEKHGLDPDYELISLPFPGDPETARAYGVLKREDPDLVPLDFASSMVDLVVYSRRGMGVEEIAQRTGLREPLVRAFFEGYDSVQSNRLN